MTRGIVVIKIGGSVLTGRTGFRRAADFLADRLASEPSHRIVAVVSAELGATDGLLAAARDWVDAPDPSTLDLLWSTGELRSAAILALALQARGVNAAGVNIHQAGLVTDGGAGFPGRARLRPLRLRALLASHDIVIAPGFLARECGDAVASLGRGGSDLTAVVLATGLGAVRCELVKDVPGYFTSDPNLDPGAQPIPALDYDSALSMADEGCELVQRQALLAAREHGLALTVRAIGGGNGTLISTDTTSFASAVA